MNRPMTLERPVLCLVTDRRRLARHLNLSPDSTATHDALLAQVRGAAAGGLTLVQVREPDMAARALRGLVREICACVEGTPARVVVNDRLDVSLAGAAHGVHLKATSVAVADARRLGPAGWIVGRSVHAVADVNFRHDPTSRAKRIIDTPIASMSSRLAVRGNQSVASI